MACLAIALVVLALLPRFAAAESPRARAVVVTVPIRGTVDLGFVPFVDRALDEAEAMGADAVVLDIDTLGGRLDAAVQIRDRVLASRVRTIAWVNPRAISAGAFVALSAEALAVSRGATIGAATPVALGAGGAATADEKTISYVRKELRATAERRGHPPEIAEAMVDAEVAIPGVIEKGKLLTLTSSEAVTLGVATLQASDMTELLRVSRLEGADVRVAEQNWAERALSIITAPLVGSLLLGLAFLGIFVELRTPGFGVPGLVGLACLALVFGGHWMVHLAGYEELLIVAAGAALVLLEIFVVPGFGLTGIAGAALLAIGLGMMSVGAGATPIAILAAVARVIAAAIVAVGAMLAFAPALGRTRFARKMVLTEHGSREREASLVGITGVTLTPLRPAGAALLGGARVDVVSDGPFVAAGEKVVAVVHEGSRVVVRLASDDQRVSSYRGGPARVS